MREPQRSRTISADLTENDQSWLRSLRELGGFHELVAPPPPGSDAVPWSRVLAGDALTARFGAVRVALATGSGLPVDDVDPRVAVSATQVSLASRLWSVTLASAVLHRQVPDLSSTHLVASPVHGGTVPLGVVDPGRRYDVSSLAHAVTMIEELVVRGSLADLDEACALVGRTSAQVLASNTTSSLVGAARVLARLRPDAGPRAWELTRALLALPGVERGGGVRDPSHLPEQIGGRMERADETFLRSGCCVFYRLPGHGLCPDCVLAESRPEQVTPGH